MPSFAIYKIVQVPWKWSTGEVHLCCWLSSTKIMPRHKKGIILVRLCRSRQRGIATKMKSTLHAPVFKQIPTTACSTLRYIWWMPQWFLFISIQWTLETWTWNLVNTPFTGTQEWPHTTWSNTWSAILLQGYQPTTLNLIPLPLFRDICTNTIHIGGARYSYETHELTVPEYRISGVSSETKSLSISASVCTETSGGDGMPTIPNPRQHIHILQLANSFSSILEGIEWCIRVQHHFFVLATSWKHVFLYTMKERRENKTSSKWTVANDGVCWTFNAFRLTIDGDTKTRISCSRNLKRYFSKYNAVRVDWVPTVACLRFSWLGFRWPLHQTVLW